MMAKPADKVIQSGNSRVKVTISGQVNRAVRFASSGGKSDFHSVDNSESNSRTRITAAGTLNKSTTATGVIEVAMAAGSRGTGFDADGAQASGGNITIRHSYVNLTNKDLGTLSLGHSTRAEGVAAIFTGFNGTSIVFHGGGPGNIDGLTPAGDDKFSGGRLGVPTTVYPGRENRIQYSTPNLMGGSLHASLNQARSWSARLSFNSPASLSKDVSVALSAAYRAQPNKGLGGSNSFGLSGGIQHNPSGLSINGVYAQELVKAGMTAATKASISHHIVGTASGEAVVPAKPSARMAGYKHTGWAADVSWTGKLMDAGSTSLTVGYGQYAKGDYQTTKGYWFALNQKVDSGAADIYFGVSYDTGDGTYTTAHTPVDAAGMPLMGEVSNGVYTAPAIVVDSTEDSFDTTCGAAAWNPDRMVGGVDSPGVTDTAKCSVARDGVLVILAGVRVKF